MRRATVAAAVAAAVLLLAPARADAHAELVETVPASGEQLDAPPPELRLSFTESVEVSDDAIEVYAAGGDVVETEAPSHPGGDGSEVAMPLPDLEDGGYVVSWRVTSSDSHPISGAFTFSVGDVSPAEAEALRDDLVADSGGDRALGIVYGVARFAAFAGIVLLVGGAAFVLGLWPAGATDRRTRRLVAFGWWVTVAATVASIGLQGAYEANGGLADALDPGVFGDGLGARTGRTWGIRLLVLAALAVLYLVARPRTGPRTRTRSGGAGGADGLAAPAPARFGDEATFLAAVLGLGVLVTVSAAGHASAGDMVPLAMVTDVVHLVGVCVWLGGLAVLAAVLLRPDAGGFDRSELDGVVGRFSTVAFASVVAIVVSGSVQGWRQLDTLDELVDTPYGRLLLIKVALVALMVVGAFFSRVWVRRRLAVGSAGGATGGAGGATGDGSGTGAEPAPVLSPGPGAAAVSPPPDVRSLRRSVGAEALVAVAVLGVTAALVNAVPGDTGSADAGGGGTFETELHGSAVLVELSVDPAEPGPVVIEMTTATHDGTPMEPEEVSGSLSLPERDLGPFDLAFEPQGTGHFVAEGVEVPFPGEWELEVVVRTSDIDQDRLATPFTVR
jgi:copper transport protein